jgi:hypothetical protein
MIRPLSRVTFSTASVILDHGDRGAASAQFSSPARSSAIERRPITCVSLTHLFCWPVASFYSTRRKPLPTSSASLFCRYGTFAPPRRGTCKGHGPASWLPMHRFVRPRLAHSRSNSPASRRPHLICVSRSDSRGFKGNPRCRSTFGGTNGWRTIGLSASRRAHVATSALSCGPGDQRIGPIHQRVRRYSSTHAADALA